MPGDFDKLSPRISTSSVQGFRQAQSKDFDKLNPGISTSSIQDLAEIGRKSSPLAMPSQHSRYSPQTQRQPRPCFCVP